MERERFASAIATTLRGRRLIVVSNREPQVHTRRDGKLEVLTPASGLTTALAPVVSASNGTWVAHGSGDADFEVTDGRGRVAVRVDEAAFRLRRVAISSELERGYYYGYSNEGLWPLCHVAYTAPFFRHQDWECYQQANRLFADAVLDEVSGEDAVVLVNDYHLALLPSLLRQSRPDLLVAQFWHVPWPSFETMRVCPQLQPILRGMLGNDLLAFHVQHHCNNFLDTVDRGIEALVDWETHSVQRKDHRTMVRPFPISIDAAAFTTMASARTFESVFPGLASRVGDRSLILGVDRLDYTKGIPQRLRVFETLLANHPEMRERIVLVQIGAPTRSIITRYQALATEVASLADEINDRYATTRWKPVEYLPAHHDRSDLAVLMRRADVCLVTPLHDGMNLVAKEYVAAQAGQAGVLVLSKFTGAARELLEACLINPYDIDGSARLLAESLELPKERRQEGMKRMLVHLLRHDVYRWSQGLLRGLDEARRRSRAREFPGN